MDIVDELTQRICSPEWQCGGENALHCECRTIEKALTEIKRLRLSLHTISSVDADVIVPERMWSEMTPLDCYEEGLMNGAMAVRDAVKTEAYAVLALGEKE